MYIPESTMDVVAENEAGILLRWTYAKKERFAVALTKKDGGSYTRMKFVVSDTREKVKAALKKLAANPGSDSKIEELYKAL